jgi:hypothetical protein
MIRAHLRACRTAADRLSNAFSLDSTADSSPSFTGPQQESLSLVFHILKAAVPDGIAASGNGAGTETRTETRKEAWGTNRKPHAHYHPSVPSVSNMPHLPSRGPTAQSPIATVPIATVPMAGVQPHFYASTALAGYHTQYNRSSPPNNDYKQHYQQAQYRK